jgi:hypothetical protein
LNDRTPAPRRWLLPLLSLLVLVGAACGEDGVVDPPGANAREVGVVLNSVDLSLSIFPVDSPQASRPPVGLGPDGSPVGFARREGLVAVPMGIVPALVVVDVEAGVVVRTVALPAGSGATGAAFLDDSTVLVANPGRNTVVPVDVGDGTTGAEIPVGRYPQAIVVSGARVGVLNAELGPDFQPDGPGTVTVLDRESLEVVGTVALGATNPGGAAPSGEGRIFVVGSGSFGGGDGSLSLVDLERRAEIGHWEGFGEFPFGVAVGPGGRVYVASFAYGLVVWDPGAASFVHSPSDPVTPEGIPSVSGLAFDSEGRLHTLRPECAGPSVVHRLDPGLEVSATWPVGACPIALAFTRLGS